MNTKTITIPKWYDLHVHVRQGPPMAAYIAAHKAMGCAGILAMPNTKPPVGKVLSADSAPYWSIQDYRAMIMAAGGDGFDMVITPLYLTAHTTPSMILEGVKTGLLQACKYYPPHGTTNSDHGRPLQTFMDNGVFKAMEDAGVVLCIHGEEHGLKGEDYFGKHSNAEDIFYREHLPCLRDQFPKLKIVCEHITTKTAVNFVTESDSNIGATITPQHLLYTVADLLQGLKYHLYCLPLVKFEEDRQALIAAVKNQKNTRFFAGTDSAPHTVKATECGCAAGCFTGGIAPQLYIQSFDADTELEMFKRFLCENGPHFYGFPVSNDTFTLVQTPQSLKPLVTDDGNILSLTLGLGQDSLPWSIQS